MAAAAAEEEAAAAAAVGDGAAEEEADEPAALVVEGGFLVQLLCKLRPYAPGGDKQSALFAIFFTIVSMLAGAAALKTVDEAWEAGTEAREEAAFLARQAEKEAAKVQV